MFTFMFNIESANNFQVCFKILNAVYMEIDRIVKYS